MYRLRPPRFPRASVPMALPPLRHFLQRPQLLTRFYALLRRAPLTFPLCACALVEYPTHVWLCRGRMYR